MEKMYKPAEFAEILHVSVKTLQRWDREGVLKACRTKTNRRYYTEEQLVEYRLNTPVVKPSVVGGCYAVEESSVPNYCKNVQRYLASQCIDEVDLKSNISLESEFAVQLQDILSSLDMEGLKLLQIMETPKAYVLQISSLNYLTEDQVSTVGKQLVVELTQDEWGNYKDSISSDMYAVAAAEGYKFVITLMKGVDNWVSLKDVLNLAYNQDNQDREANSVLLGLDEQSNLITDNLRKNILVFGEARSGKTYFVENMLFQLCGMQSPKNLSIELFDVKNTCSDFAVFAYKLPHIRSYNTEAKGIIERLEYLAEVEGDRRKGLAYSYSDNSFVEKGMQENNIPETYIIVDELDSLYLFSYSLGEDWGLRLNNALRKLSSLKKFGMYLILIAHRDKGEIKCMFDRDNLKVNFSNRPSLNFTDLSYKCLHIGEATYYTGSRQGYLYVPYSFRSAQDKDEYLDNIAAYWKGMNPAYVPFVGNYNSEVIVDYSKERE